MIPTASETSLDVRFYYPVVKPSPHAVKPANPPTTQLILRPLQVGDTRSDREKNELVDGRKKPSRLE